MPYTEYKRFFLFSLFDIIPPEWDFKLEYPFESSLETKLRFDLPKQPDDFLKVKAFTVEGVEEERFDEDDIIFWGAFWLILLGWDLKIGVYIGR